MILEKLKKSLDQEGYKFSAFNIKHLKTAQKEFKNLHKNGIVDETFYRKYLLDFQLVNIPKDAKSIIIIAMPHYSSKIKFTNNDKETVVVLPPQYAYPALEEKVFNLVKEAFSKENISFKSAKLPLKYLAAMSGLCKIGKNNLCYIESSGSFLRLTGFITNLIIKDDQWPGVSMLKSCKNCNLCTVNCPTKAIPNKTANKDRYLIHAQNCLTYFNENTSEIPKWVNPQCHNSIVGCMNCQIVCPHNRKSINYIDLTMSFNEVETMKVLNKESYEALDNETQNKLYELGLTEYYDVLSRNLSLLLENDRIQ